MMGGNLEIPGISCDGCSRTLLVDESVRYVLDIRIYAAYDPMEITRADLGKDRAGEIQALVEACKKMTPEELEDQVYKELRFHLCPPCQKRYIRDPLGKEAPGGPGEETSSATGQGGKTGGPGEAGSAE